MRIKNNFVSLIFRESNDRYYMEVVLLIAVSIGVYFYFMDFMSISPHLNYNYPEMNASFFNVYLFYASYPLFNIFYILTIVISSYEIFLFSSSIMKNKFIVLYSMGFKKDLIILSYYTVFLLYPLFLFLISFFLITYIDFLSIKYSIIGLLLLFTCVNLTFYLSIGFLIATFTKNYLIPGAFIIVLFYLLVPFVYIRPQNTIIYHLFDSTRAYLNFGFNSIAIHAIIIEFIISGLLLILSMLIANYRDMKVIR
jgi:hypothetical protein